MKLAPAHYLIFLLLFSNCAGEVKPSTSAIQTPESKIISPAEFKDLILRGFAQASYAVIDSVVPKRNDIVESLHPSDSALREPHQKEKFDAFADNVTNLVQSKAKSSYESVLDEGNRNGITWNDSNVKVSYERVSGKNFPVCHINVTYQTKAGYYKLKIQADSLSRGFLLGNKFILIKEDL